MAPYWWTYLRESPVNDTEIYEFFANALWSDISESDEFYNRHPLLAHYTSIQTLEKILDNNEIWFSNPLLMNDLEELQFGINEGARLFREHRELRSACGSDARYLEIQAGFDVYYDEMDFKHAFDTYALCFSEHERDDTDGLLSMWRGYGGNGSGVAIVFDTSKIEPVEETPFILAKVHYASSKERRIWISAKIDELAELIRASNIPDQKLDLAAYAFFQRLKLFALFTKHPGFKEENEWRVVYLPDLDEDGRVAPMLSYAIGERGIEPILKFKIGPVDGATGDSLSLELLVERIILGPSGSGNLAAHGVRRMLERLGKSELSNRLVRSSTPYRPI